MAEYTEFVQYADEVDAPDREGDRRMLAVQVNASETPDVIELGDPDDRGPGWSLEIEQARDLLYMLQQAIDAAELNRRRAYGA